MISSENYHLLKNEQIALSLQTFKPLLINSMNNFCIDLTMIFFFILARIHRKIRSSFSTNNCLENLKEFFSSDSGIGSGGGGWCSGSSI